MNITCEYCKKDFSSSGNLAKHQKTAKYCIKIQKEQCENIVTTQYTCDLCNKDFSSKHRLECHKISCSSRYNFVVENTRKEHLEIISSKNTENAQLKLKIENLIILNNELQDKLKTVEYETELRVLRENKPIEELLHNIAIKAIEQKNEVITNMVKKYVKKQPRKQYECSNVIYILTTSSLKNDRRYILGKAKNLTNRLSTYNKSDEHEVIYYLDCEDEEAMNAMEPFVFKKLNEYREQANRERFILPKDKNIEFFIDTIKNCFEFLK